MKTLFILFLPALLYATLFNSELNNVSENKFSTNIYIDSVDPGDSSEQPIEDNPTEGNNYSISGAMFNERGFYNSSSFSYDESQMVNDFNGNLMYSVPIYNFKGRGDLNVNLSLNYNGSVSHSVFLCNLYYASTQTMPRTTMNIPSYILSLNGWAVQISNFETDYFTTASTSGQTIVRDNIKWLADGYQLTNKLTVAESEAIDQIYLMRGDGSVLTLRNETASNLYTGMYYTQDRSDNMVGYVNFRFPDPQSNYTDLRYLDLFPGDGLRYYFEEEYIFYNDYDLNTHSVYPNTINRPKCFYLKSIIDRFGNLISPNYEGDNKQGRKRLDEINVSWITSDNFIKLDYTFLAGYTKMRLFNSSRGNYEIDMMGGGILPTDRHIAYVTNIKNPENRNMHFENVTYYRKALNARYQLIDHVNLAMTSDIGVGSQLKRMSYCINYAGGKRSYNYFGDESYLEVDLVGLTQQAPAVRSNSSYFRGQGRDPFYNNMVGDVKYYDKGVTDANKYYKRDSYTYTFYRPGGLENNPYQLDPVNDEDLYTSSKIVSKNPNGNYSNVNNSIEEYSVQKLYRNFQIGGNYVNLEVSDWPGFIKLFKEETFANGNNIIKKTDYIFAQGVPNTIYNSSNFLDTMVVDSIYTGSGYTVNKVKTRYTYNNGFPLAGTNQRNPIIQTTVIDTFGLTTKTDYLLFNDSTFYYVGDNAGTGVYEPGPYLDTLRRKFIKFSVPNLVTKYVNPNVILEKTEFFYVMDKASTEGYIGQLLKVRNYVTPSLGGYWETRNEYYKSDSTGAYLYAYDYTNKPSVEGNLKSAIDANGNRTNYYYFPQNALENTDSQTPVEDDYEGPIWGQEGESMPPSIPKVGFYKAYFNETVIANSIWQDSRMPIRTDNFVNSNRYLTNYVAYDEAGNLTRTIDNNKYFSTATYDNVYRVTSAVLPYDFNSSIATKDTIRDTVISEVGKRIAFSRVGFKNFVSSSNSSDTTVTHSNQLISPNSGGTGNILKIDKRISYGGIDSPENIYTLPVFEFPNDPALVGLYEIDSAFITFAPDFFFHDVNGNTNNSAFNFKIKTLETFSFTPNLSSPNTYDGKVSLTPSYTQTASVNANRTTPVSSCNGIYNVYDASRNKINITNLLTTHIVTANKPLKGFLFDVDPDETFEIIEGYIDLRMSLSNCITYNTVQAGIYYGTWGNEFSPQVYIYGRTRRINTRIVNRFAKATLSYDYDDANNRVTVLTNLDNGTTNSRNIKTENFYDGFYRPTESRQYIASNSFYSDTTEYNYLDAKSSYTDNKGNKSKFSYNKYLSLSKTENPDASYTLVNEAFQDDLTYTFSTVYGPINVKEFVDEVGNKIVKYTDIVGNLRREMRFVAGTPTPQEEFPPQEQLITDYKYDELYRVIEVRTPENKRIYYSYDGYGRVGQRITPDAGTTQYGYDLNGNMTYSRDANQTNQGNNVYTFRTYDGISRIKGIGVTNPSGGQPNWDNVNFETEFSDTEDNPNDPFANYLTINVYDTLVSSEYSFIAAPSGYNSTLNNTQGKIVVTAYRTLKTDSWSYKWYRYDARGRVIKMWNVIDGFNTKVIQYTYNSADMVGVTTYQIGESDFKKFRNGYDVLGRLAHVDYWDPNVSPDPEIPEGDSPTTQWINLTEYSYNQNSQISRQDLKTNSNAMEMLYEYNNRNWLTGYGQKNTDDPGNPDGIFTYDLNYFTNGNISNQYLAGSYKNNFSNTDVLSINYTYDLANRLIKSDVNNFLGDPYDIVNSYDKDGNITSLERYDVYGTLDDDFNYTYYSGTNRLKDVTSSMNDYTYDYNGNMTSDDLNGNSIIEYDHRNLITKIVKVTGSVESPNVVHQITLYKYDDAGNRIRKAILEYTGTPPEEIGGNIDNPPTGWSYIRNEFYVRGTGGNVIAEYNSYDLEQYNLLGADNFGKMDIDARVYFYFKDHLGSVRTIIDMDKNIISSQDYDIWGYLMEDRQYEITQSEYKFTSKERDNESNYDYFGARYYDSRIGRWGQTEPLVAKYVSYSPYIYAGNNSINLSDINGLDWIIYPDGASTPITVKKPGAHRYFVEHPGGNFTFWEMDEQGHYTKKYLEGNFYEVHSEATLQRYFNPTQGGRTKYSKEDVKQLATDRNYAYLNTLIVMYQSFTKDPYISPLGGRLFSWPILLVGLMSQNTGPADFKRVIELEFQEFELYVFKNKVFNNQEAGNIMWGGFMRRIGYNYIWALWGADIYAMIDKSSIFPLNIERDEPNEQSAALLGWYYY